MSDSGSKAPRDQEWENNEPLIKALTNEEEEPLPSEPPTPTRNYADGEKDDSSIEKEKETEAEAVQPHESHPVSRFTSRRSATTQNTESSNVVSQKKSWNPLKWNPPPIPAERGVSHEYTASKVSKLFFHWMTPILTTGYKRPLEITDLWKVNPDRSSRVLADKLNASFRKRRERGDKRALLGALFDTVKYEFIIGGACQLTQSVVQVITPYILKYLIQFSEDAWFAKFRDQPAPPISHGIGIVVGIWALQSASSLAGNHFLYKGMIVGGQVRAVLMTIIFDKAMRISGRARAGGRPILEMPPPEIQPGSEEEKKWYGNLLKKSQKKQQPADVDAPGILGDGRGWSNGRIINLMSVDAYRIDQASGFFHMLWTAPIQLVISIILLIVNLSYSAVAGMALLFFAMPLLARAIRSLLTRRIGINKITDQRVSLTQEVLQAVRFVKYFGWETPFLNRIFAIRKREIFSIQKLLATRNAINAVSMSMPIYASMVAFIVYSVTKHPLNPAPVFSSLSLFNGLRMPLNFLPLVLGQVVDAISSVRRIEEFLLAEEQEDDFEWDYGGKSAIAIDHADFTWERTPNRGDADQLPGPGGRGPGGRGPPGMKKEKKDKKAKKGAEVILAKPGGVADEPTPFQLKDIHLSVGRDELIGVIGTVGSGKSSLLAALAGDMRKTRGSGTLGATRAFCPQYAWIQNATVKENIVFGRDFNAPWYNKVVDACALRPDLEMLPMGDATEIGERGITISGGQKQRLNIARAIYFDADIVLLDDPLSAVDAHVGRHIMDNAICGLLKGKCRILATHQLHVISRCDRIVWMDGGRIRAVDTYDNLMAKDVDFQKLLATTAAEAHGEDAEKEEEDEKDEKKAEKEKTPRRKRGGQLMTVEDRAVAAVGMHVYLAYVRAAGGLWVFPLVIILLILSMGSNIMTSQWLAWWTSNKFSFTLGKYIGVYAALGASQSIMMFLFSVSLSVFGTQASKHMLRDAMRHVMRAPMSFFDTTPLGRITNRFSKDIDTMDNNLTDAIRMYLMSIGQIFATFTLIIVYFHYFAVALGPLFLFFLFAASYYRSSAREIKRHEAVQRSSVFARFSEAVVGVSTIRAYGLQNHFAEGVRDAIDAMNGCYFLTFANQRWLSIRLDVIGNLLILTVGILVVTSRFTVDPSIGGLVLSYILSIVQMIQMTVRQLAEVENNMNSAERLQYYATDLEEEPSKQRDVRDTWPEKGEIVFKDIEMRYRKGLPLVLKGLNLHVGAGERIGIVGRTGAGKSSIMTTLFRMVELSGGSITIDGVDIADIGLEDLRTRLSIIPQDPTLFKGTVRSNLDPFGQHADLDLWSALRQAGLVESDTIVSAEQANEDSKTGGGRITLDATVEEEGLNFSLGQRQMMALARALVRGSQIIVCDEATSSVDFETDAKIQNTIMTAFKGKTLLCIAHRLKTIISYDRIVVMDQGEIAEMDTPINLFDKQDGIFRGMCERSRITREEIAAFAK